MIPAPDPSPLDARLSSALGGRTAGALQKAFGIETVGGLLEHYPRRYARRGELTALSKLPLGENVTIVADVLDVRERDMKARKGSILEVRISDGTGILSLTFFNQRWRAQRLRPGVRGIFAGKISDYKGTLQLAHPDFQLFDDDEVSAADEAAASGVDDVVATQWAQTPIPIYPATATVTSWQIQQSLGVVLDSLPALPDPVPDSVRAERGLLTLARALELVHRPSVDEEWRRARDTLRFHEAFILQTALLQRREELRSTAATRRDSRPGGLRERFDARLPFALTGDQTTVGREIDADLAAEVPMSRLVQGEVGSGKTLVAVRAMLAVAESGGQAALLAPTEVLAAQHVRSITATLGPELAAELVPTLLTGGLPVADRRRATLRIVSGQARIVVGTHALLSDDVAFYDLGLVVVDEQHRFGVDQREALRSKGATPPHVLVLTATPIPRTVAMTVFGDLDVSTIRELPAGRPGISSFVVHQSDRPRWLRVWDRAADEIELGRQVYVVCPAIEAGGKPTDGAEAAPTAGDEAGEETEARAPLASVEATSALLRTHPRLGSRRIEALHGRMSSDEKDSVMQRFAAGEIDVLVSTTVIEVGVDVHNASVMIVQDAERFGVSQLHQLRGRIGRGGIPGICLFVTNAEEESIARERVEAVAATLDGFELAQVDLELRREGDVLGLSQSGGRSSLRLLRVVHDSDLIAEARDVAAVVLARDPELADEPGLRDALRRRLGETEKAFLVKS